MTAHEAKSRDDQVDAAVAEFLEAIDRGEKPQAAEWLKRYPHLVSELDQFFGAYPMRARNLSLVSDADSPRSNRSFEKGAASTESMPDPFPGEFRFIRLLGEGNFGKVYLADDLNLKCQVAIKTLKLPAASTHDPDIFVALKKEAQQLASLRHPNIVRVHAWRESGGECFVVHQFVPGGSLGDRLKKEGPLRWQDASKYVADVGEALIETHNLGIVHRDIKPDNILWDPTTDEALLADFGVSARLAEPGSAAGTPTYMAPEAFSGDVTAALDVYSLSATLFRLVTGAMPFAEVSSIKHLLELKRVGLPEPDPRCISIPEPLEQVIRGGLAADPRKRLDSSAFVGALRTALNHLLVDDLVLSSLHEQAVVPANVQLIVNRRLEEGRYETVAETKRRSIGLSRDMKKAPRQATQVHLKTGDEVRIDLVTDRDGYVTVLNIGPTGNLNLLYPDEASLLSTSPLVTAHQRLHVVDVQMHPPTGREQLLAMWSRQPLKLSMSDLVSLVDHDGRPGSRGYRATRDMKRLRTIVHGLTQGEWCAVGLELSHI